jgi:hypothetical protein
MRVDIDKLNTLRTTLSEREQKILDIVVKKDGTIRASKPTKTKKIEPDLWGEAAYVWRMVVFQVSRNPVHQCMPVCADFDIRLKFDERRKVTRVLDSLVDKIVDLVPVTQWHGILRWGRALGY